MAALNKTETEALCTARGLIDRVLRDGYDPEKDKLLGALLKDSSKALRTVVMMKGYFPS